MRSRASPVAEHADRQGGERGHRPDGDGDLPAQAHCPWTARLRPVGATGLIGAGDVADAAHGVDQPLLPAGLGLAPEVADVHGEVLRIRSEVVVPDPLVDRRVVEDDAGVADEQLEEVELRLRQVELVVASPDAAGGGVDAQVAESQFRRPHRAGRLVVGAAEQGSDTCQQLAEVERLGQVVVGSGVEPGDAVAGVGPGREHQDRHPVALAAQDPADGETVDDGHRDVEEEGVGGLGGQPGQRLGAVLDGRHDVALERQGPLEGRPHGAIVLGD